MTRRHSLLRCATVMEKAVTEVGPGSPTVSIVERMVTPCMIVLIAIRIRRIGIRGSLARMLRSGLTSREEIRVAELFRETSLRKQLRQQLCC